MVYEQERGPDFEPPAWETARTHAKRTIAAAAALITIGLAISIVTYVMASQNPHGGSYFVAWGPVVFGVITAVRGVSALRKANAWAMAARGGKAVDHATND
jgi:hypothetical protein